MISPKCLLTVAFHTVPPSSPKPFAWPYRPEDEVCPVHTQIGTVHSPTFSSFILLINRAGRDDTESSAAAADNSLDNTSSNYGGDEAESSASATETLINLDPAHYFNWFVATSHFGVGIFSEM